MSQKWVLGLGELRPCVSTVPCCNCTSASPVFMRGRCEGSNSSKSSAHINSTLRFGLVLLSSTRKYWKSSRSFLNSCLRVSLIAALCFFIAADPHGDEWRSHLIGSNQAANTEKLILEHCFNDGSSA